MKPSDITRFWSKVDVSGGPESCWPWLGSRMCVGRFCYGQIWIAGKTRLAHRVAYELEFGPIPKGQHIRHTCDNPACVNAVRHMVLGTQRDNMRDRIEHGAGYARGTNHHNAKLTPAAVVEARVLRSQGWSYYRLATRFVVNRSTIEAAVRGKTWTHLGAAPDNLPRTVHIPDEKIFLALELRKSKVPWREIERIIGYSRKWIQTRAKAIPG